MFADAAGEMVRAHAPSCSNLTVNEHSHDLEDFFGEMPSMPHVPIAEASSVTVQGRLKEHSHFWLTELEASNFVRGIVQHGYRIPFLSRPAPVFRFNHQSALQNEQFISSEISNLVEKDVFFNVMTPLLCVAHFQ